MTPPFSFTILHKSTRSNARVGQIQTPHGVIDTPNFVAVGTNGTLKAIDNQMVSQLGLQLMFCNTYHLLLQPGTEVIRQAGGIHSFINRKLPIITDSGGFQVFSLAYGSVAKELKSQGTKQRDGGVVNISHDGVTFRSYRTGEKILLTPEKSIMAQKDLGADIIIPFDELPPYHIDPIALEKSLARTHEWEKRSLTVHKKNPQNQAMYAVVHGGLSLALRQQSALFLRQLPFDGFALGGSMGKTKKEMVEMLEATLPLLPKTAPNHLLGIADLDSLERCVPLGIDTFDSSYPTKAARHGTLLTSVGPVKIGRTAYRRDFTPIDPNCACPTCTFYHKAYLHHLFKAKEVGALSLASIHNLAFMVEKMRYYRNQIAANLV